MKLKREVLKISQVRKIFGSQLDIDTATSFIIFFSVFQV